MIVFPITPEVIGVVSEIYQPLNVYPIRLTVSAVTTPLNAIVNE